MSLRRKNQPASVITPWIPIIATSALLLMACWGVYAHRQNQDVERRRQINALETEVAQLKDKRDTLDRELSSRLRCEVLQETLRQKNIPLQQIRENQIIDLKLIKNKPTDPQLDH